MLNEIRFGNFKSFRRSQSLPLRPITLIFGKNSTGKSSVLQILRLMSAAVVDDLKELPYDDPSIGLVSHQHVTHRMNGNPIDVSLSFHHHKEQPSPLTVSVEYDPKIRAMSLYSDLIFPRNGAHLRTSTFLNTSVDRTPLLEDVSSQEIVMCMSGADTFEGLCEKYHWANPSPHDLKWLIDWFDSVRKEAREIRLARGHNQSTILDLVAICESRLKDEINFADRKFKPSVLAGLVRYCQLQMAYAVRSQASVRELGLVAPRGQNIESLVTGALEGLLRRYAYRTEIAEAVRRETLSSIVAVFVRSIERLQINGESNSRRYISPLGVASSELRAVRYLGPTREVRSRYELEYLKSSGSETALVSKNIIALLSSIPESIEFVNRGFQALGIGYQAELIRLEVGSVTWLGNVMTLVLRDSAGTRMSLEDVGFGVGQVLPILLEMQLGGCLLIEQPELHLHPALQGDLAEELVKAVRRTNGQVILETHSEHMVLRLQRMIRRGQLSPDEVAILAVTAAPDSHQDPAQVSSSIRRLEIDETGFLVDPWPPGFFDSALEEMFSDW